MKENANNLANHYPWANTHPTVVLTQVLKVGSFQLSTDLCLILL